MKLIKDGKLFDMSKAILVATSQWYMSYGLKRKKLYKSVNGQFFNVEEETSLEDIKKIRPTLFFDFKKGFYFDIEPNKVTITRLITDDEARRDFEYISTNGRYGSNHGTFEMMVHLEYEDLFKLIEG
jgi:hypothetical protein